jgi:hypothetical protein
MHIADAKGANGKGGYEVSFEERRLEELLPHLNRLERADEQPFEAVAAVSDFNQRAYELFVQPLVQGMSNDYSAKLQRSFHPLRFQRWALSDLNPALAWLGPAAEMVKQQRKALPADHPLRRSESLLAELTSAAMDYQRGVRDAVSEAQFFQVYGHMFSLYLADRPQYSAVDETVKDPRDAPVVKEALSAIDRGGYAEATARAAFLLGRKGEPLPLSRLELKKDLMTDYRDLLPAMTMDEARRVRGEQELIVRYEPDQAVATLPSLLPEKADRQRLVSLMERLLGDQRLQKVKPLPEQIAMLERIRGAFGAEAAAGRRRRPATRTQRSHLQ